MISIVVEMQIRGET